MYFFADAQCSPSYVFVHEDALTVDTALRAAQCAWTFVGYTMQDRLSRRRSDADYSPSKPASKISRLAAAVAASVFSH